MISKLYIPSYPLNQFIESFFYYTGYNPEHSVDRFLPDGNVQIIFDLKVEIEFDPEPRIVPMNYPLERALEKNKKAKIAFKKLTSSHKKEILVYLNI